MRVWQLEVHKAEEKESWNVIEVEAEHMSLYLRPTLKTPVYNFKEFKLPASNKRVPTELLEGGRIGCLCENLSHLKEEAVL